MDFEVLESDNVKLVMEMLSDSGDKRDIEYKSTDELPIFTGSTSGAVRSSTDLIEVFLNNDVAYFLQEDVIVHEILHLVLENEGYPTVDVLADFYYRQGEGDKKMIDMALGVVRSSIHHPEIYRRQIELFNMDLDSIFKYQVEKKRAKFLAEKPRGFYHIGCQQDIIESIDFPYFPPPYNEEVLGLYQELLEDNYNASQELYEKLEGVDMHNPEGCREGAQIILDFIIEYGRQHGIDEAPYHNHIWRNFRIR